jgi:hypothetical protein
LAYIWFLKITKMFQTNGTECAGKKSNICDEHVVSGNN